VTETIEFKRGPGGRPSREEAERRRGVLLQTAMRLFLDRGFEAVSVEEIAKQAGVAKRFIYARYGDKSELFVAAIEYSFVDKFEVLRSFTPSARGPEQGLYELARTLLDMLLQPDVISLRRLMFAVAPQFPDIIKQLAERNRERGLGQVERSLAFYADRGEIEFPKSQTRLIVEQFFICVAGIPQRLALLEMSESPAEREQRLRLAVRLFVRGIRAERAGGT
jgi:TetR/AcrR family transcriptional regulator, mexJK operon transcriptional repressor